MLARRAFRCILATGKALIALLASGWLSAFYFRVFPVFPWR
jgi:hypothetical protein